MKTYLVLILVIIQCLSYDIMAQSRKYYELGCSQSLEITFDSLLGEAIGKERYEQFYNLRESERCARVFLIVELEPVDSNAKVAVVSKLQLIDLQSFLSESEKERFIAKIFSTVFPDCSGYIARGDFLGDGGYLEYLNWLDFNIQVPRYKPNFLYPKE